VTIAVRYTDEFERFWKAYPRHNGTSKWAAFCEYNRIVTKGIASHTEIMLGLKRYAFSDKANYQPHARTWLHQRRWEIDTQDTAPVTTQKPASRASWRDKYDAAMAIHSQDIFTIDIPCRLHPEDTTVQWSQLNDPANWDLLNVEESKT
jgi:hypothetical protein